MKTRREFLKTTLQCLGLVGAVSFAPSYALAKIIPPEKVKGEEQLVTSGYAQMGTVHHANVTITVTSTDNFESGNAWSVVDARR